MARRTRGGEAATWYFPRWAVRRAARSLDRRSLSGGPGRGGYGAVLHRLDAGTGPDGDVTFLMTVVGRVWAVVTVLSVVPSVMLAGLAGLLHVPVPGWMFGVAVSLLPGMVSFALVLYFHSFASIREVEDPDDETWLVRHFSVPRRVNLLVIPLFLGIGYVVIGVNTGWYH